MNRSHARATASAILLACAGLAGCAQAGSAIRAEEQGDRASDDPAYWEALPPVQQAIAAARQYYEEAYARSPVQFEANIRVRDTTTGAFTRAGTEQRAVLYQVATLSRGFPDLGLAILEGDRLVANFAHSLLAESVDTMRGLEASGRDAIAFEGGLGWVVSTPEASGSSSFATKGSWTSGRSTPTRTSAAWRSTDPTGRPVPRSPSSPATG